MNVTTKKSECDTRQHIRQLEVAIEHAKAAALAVPRTDEGIPSFVEVRYPSYQFRETLRALKHGGGEIQGRWVVVETQTAEACKAACIVLGHYYPDEDFAIAEQTVDANADLATG
jgi:hypothetical protein